MSHRPIIVWFRRDLRLSDHPALTAAAQAGAPIIPVFIWDEVADQIGAAPCMRWGQSIAALDRDLRAIGSALILRRGSALAVLRDLVQQTGAQAVYWSRLYDPQAVARDTEVKAALKAEGVDCSSFAGHLLFEPWTVKTKEGGYYRVYSPMWRAVKSLPVEGCLPQPTLTAPDQWPASDRLDDWQLDRPMRRGGPIVAAHQCVGEAAAQARLARFLETRIDSYKARRDYPADHVTSGLSENLTYGEIAPLALWHAGQMALEAGSPGAEHFLKEVVWREFAYHLMWHTPHILTRNWREEWDAFPWNTDENHPDVLAWKQGRTGEPFVDAAMREMWVTGTMHNRARMIVASYLTKHLMTHWRIGMEWFADCLTDWDPAANAMGWQWTAGSGPDAAPYFRIFNPETQIDTYDPDRLYLRKWIAERYGTPSDTALSYFEAVPLSWGLSKQIQYPKPIVSLSEGRAKALAAYEARTK